MTREKAERLREKIEQASTSLPDVDALTVTELFPSWKPNVQYAVDNRVQYGGLLYKCVQEHTSLSNWTPDVASALWVLVSIEEWPEWVQPLGAHDAYPNGAKVAHNGDHWISDIDANVYEPGSYGWSKVV